MNFPAVSLIDNFPNDPNLMTNLTDMIGQFAVRLVVALVILAVTVWLAGLAKRVVKRAFARIHPKGDTDVTLANFISSLARYAVLVMGLIAVLAQLGVQTTSILAVLGAASIAIGLALQGTLGNVAAGVMLLILRPYRVGDYCELAGRNGTVLALDLFVTTLDDIHGLRLTIPNGQIFGAVIVNYTVSGKRRIDLDFGVDYEDDLDKALEVLLACAAADERILKTPEPWCKVTALADSSVTCTLRFWVKSKDFLAAGPDMVKTAKAALEAAGVTFPYPQQVEMSRAQARGLTPVESPAVVVAPATPAGPVAKAPAKAPRKTVSRRRKQDHTPPDHGDDSE